MSGTATPPPPIPVAAPAPMPPPATEPNWAKTVVSVAAMLVFAFAYWVSWITKTGLEQMNGAAIGGFFLVMNYWMGNSADSDKKTNIISRAAHPPAPPPPPISHKEPPQ